jgi:hypothetical protein
VTVAEGEYGQVRAAIRYQPGTLRDRDAELEIPRPRWWTVVAALVALCCSVLATMLIPVRVTELATPLRNGNDGTISALVWSARPPESFLSRQVFLTVDGARVEAQVRAASPFVASGARSAPPNSTTATTPAVMITVGLPPAAARTSPSRIEVDFGQRSLFDDFLG